MNAGELAHLDAIAQAELVRTRQVQPLELVEAAIDRIERVNPALNAVVTPMFDEARRAAAGKLPEGPFRGVPYLLKDLLAAYAGVRMTAGSAFLRDFVPGHDTELVARLKRAGLVVAGKTNTPEFGILPTTEPRLFGPARNPWNTGRTTGGSSGGSAAAVAARLVPMSHANDGGGSIRIPASCCGVFGLKPTRARVPLGPEVGDVMGGLVVEHAVTLSVRDCAALLDATAGPGVGDPYWAPLPERPFAQEVGRETGKLRIAFTTAAPTGAKIAADCASAVREVAELCAGLGHEVEEAAPQLDAQLMIQAFLTIWAAGCAWSLDGLGLLTGRAATAEDVEPLTWTLCEMGRKSSGSAYLLAQTVLQRVAREVGRFMTRYDAFLTPTLSEPPLPLGSFESPPEDPMRAFWRAVEFVPFTPLANVTGQPAMSVPLVWNSQGLPIGVHFFGRYGDEATLFRLAAQLEAARPWAIRRPAVCAI
jgi:amidase